MATKPLNTSAFINQLLAPLPAGEAPADTPFYRQQLADDAKAAAEIYELVRHIEHLRTVVGNAQYSKLQREMAGIVLEAQEATYASKRRAA